MAAISVMPQTPVVEAPVYVTAQPEIRSIAPNISSTTPGPVGATITMAPTATGGFTEVTLSGSPSVQKPVVMSQTITSGQTPYRTQQPAFVTSPQTAEPTTATMPGQQDATALEHAMQAGRVYMPSKSSFVPGYLVARAGMQTIYDSQVVLTFESELEFANGTRAAALLGEPVQATESQGELERGVTVTTHRTQGKKKTCC